MGHARCRTDIERLGALPCFAAAGALVNTRTHTDYCRICWLRTIAQHPRLSDVISKHGDVSVRQLQRGDALYNKGEHFHSLFIVREGLIKSSVISYEGDYKVIALHLPGEMFGLSGIATGQHMYDTAALTASELCVVPYPMVSRAVQDNLVFAKQMFQVVSCANTRHQMLAETMEHLTAERKIAALLLNLSERYARSGHDPDHFPFPMTRIEMANYVGLSHETASRVMSRLRGIATLDNASGRILRRHELELIAGDCDWSDHCNCNYFGC